MDEDKKKSIKNMSAPYTFKSEGDYWEENEEASIAGIEASVIVYTIRDSEI